MKKLVTLFLLSVVVFAADAQQLQKRPVPKNLKAFKPVATEAITGGEVFEQKTATAARGPVRHSEIHTLGKVTKFGETTYDLPAQQAQPRRIIRYPDGKISIVFTYSGEFNSNYGDRGTGYAHFNGTEWSPIPEKRIESRRTGWPSIALMGDGREFITSHNVNPSGPADTSISVSRNTPEDRFTFSRNSPLGTIKLINTIWPRTAAAGNNHYIISIDNDDVYTAPNGIENSLFFHRSTDGGATYEAFNLLPEYDSSRYSAERQDVYDIDARDSIVAIVLGNTGQDITLWKSTNYGASFQKIVIDSFPIAAYNFANNQLSDVDADGIADTVRTVAGGIHALIDNDNKVHVFWGEQYITADGSSGFIFNGNAINHWDERNNRIDSIGGAIDIDGDGDIEAGANYSQYPFAGYAIFPTAGIDERGNIYLVYSAVVDGDTTDEDISVVSGQAFRDLYCVMSKDGGETWTAPINLTNPTGEDLHKEDAFPSLARFVDGSLHLAWQQDFEPGYAVGTNEDITINELFYMEVDVNLVNGVSSSHEQLSGVELEAYPNPAKNAVTFSVNLEKQMNIDFSMSTILGQQILNIGQGSFAAGNHSFTVNLSDLSAGVYLYTLRSNGQTVTNKLVITQ